MKKLLLSALMAATIATASATLTDVGYCNDTYFYPYSGLTIDHNANIGVAVKIPADMIANYAGGKIIGLKIAAGSDASNHPVTAFLRKGTLDSENLTSTNEYISYNQSGGWDQILYDTEWTIPEGLDEDIYFGVFTSNPERKYILNTSTLSRKADAGQYYLTEQVEGEKDDWFDISELNNYADYTIIAIRAIIELPDESYQNVMFLTKVVAPKIGIEGETTDALVYIKNDGQVPITSFEMTYTLGDKTFSQPITLEEELPVGFTTSRGNRLPIKYLGTGTQKVSITKVNGVENDAAEGTRTAEIEIISVPQETAEKYTRRPLVEYYCSESDHNSGTFEANMMVPGMAPFAGQVTYLPHHSNDKFGQNPVDVPAIIDGKEDILTLTDGDRLAQALYGGSLGAISIPSMVIDRTVQIDIAVLIGAPTAVMGNTLYPGDNAASIAYREALRRPTFASIDLTSKYDADNATVEITAAGTIEDNILPEGEKAKLSVFIIEETVQSDSQELPESESVNEQYPDGIFTHARVIRQTVTPFNGDEIEAGDFSKNYKVDIENPRWNTTHMKVVAILQRPETNDMWNRDIINTAEAPMTDDYVDSITEVEEITDAPAVYYNINGQRVASPAVPGVYLEQRGNTTRKIYVK